MEELVFNEAGEGEVGFETFKDEGFVGGGFLFLDDGEVFVDLAVIDLHFDRAELSGFSSAFFLHEFFFIAFEAEVPERAEGSFVVSDMIVHDDIFYRI